MDHASLILGAIAVVELLVIVIGSIWSIGRDLWIRRQSEMLADKLSSMTDAIEKVAVINDRVTEKLRSTDDLSREQRRELMDMLRENKRESGQLILDVERRIQECIRQLQSHGSLSVNTFTGPSATVAQGQDVNQNRS